MAQHPSTELVAQLPTLYLTSASTAALIQDLEAAQAEAMHHPQVFRYLQQPGHVLRAHIQLSMHCLQALQTQPQRVQHDLKSLAARWRQQGLLYSFQRSDTAIPRHDLTWEIRKKRLSPRYSLHSLLSF